MGRWSSQLQSGPFSSLDNSIMIIFLMPHMRQQEKPHVRAACCCQHQCKSESKSWNKKYRRPTAASWPRQCHCCSGKIYLLVFLNFSVNLRIDFVIDDSTINLATFLVNLLKVAFRNFWINFIC